MDGVMPKGPSNPYACMRPCRAEDTHHGPCQCYGSRIWKEGFHAATEAIVEAIESGDGDVDFILWKLRGYLKRMEEEANS